MKVRFGVGLGVGNVLSSAAQLGEVVDQLEDLSFDSLWMSDRVVGAALDPIAALAFAAGRTSHLKLGTNVLVLPGRDPFMVARQLAAVDALSDGRLLPAVGLGRPSRHDRPPFAVPRGTRAQRFEDDLATIRAQWAEDPSVRPLEVWFGGKSTPALERAGRLGDGWIGSFQTPAETGAARRVIEAAATAADRHVDDDHYGTTIFYARERRTELGELVVQTLSEGEYVPEVLLPLGADELTAVVADYVREGITKFVLVPADRPDDWRAELAWLKDVVGPLET